VRRPAGTRWVALAVLAAFVVGSLVGGLVVAAGGDDVAPRAEGNAAAPSEPTPSASASPVRLARVGGLPVAIPDRTITDPRLLPYPFMSPTPTPAPTAVDGTYLRTVELSEVGGARIGLPFRCFRCPPYRIDAGVTTLIFARGAYYLHHHLSGFRTLGSYVLEGDRMTLFNDANCPQVPGVYAFEVTAHGIRLEAVEDECPYSGERADDLEFETWTRVSACVRRIKELWPGEVAC
jgi:hypothetical protein